MIESILLTIVQQWHLIVPAVVLAYLVSDYYGKGLHKYPGPVLARFTNIWRFVDVWNRRPDITHIELHRKHGDVVRLGPNTLSFSDPAAIKTIYGLNKGFVKVRVLSKPITSQLIKIVWFLPTATSCLPRETSAIPLLNYRRSISCFPSTIGEQRVLHECSRTVRATCQ